jgi:hypothetical protein
MADSPDRDARAARVFWDPELCPAVIPARAEPAAAGSGLRLRDLAGSIAIARDESGLQHVLLREGGHALQLAVSGADVLRPVRLLTDLMLDARVSRARLEAIGRFNRLCHRGRMEPGRSGPVPGALRLRLVLQALDGFLENLSQREVAERMFGAPRVCRDWCHPGGHLRDCVRRAIRRGRRLIESEYRLLLQ